MKVFGKKGFKFILSLFFIVITILLSVGLYNVYKPLPEGISYAGKVWPVDEIAFYKDLTWVDEEGRRHSQQEIFNQVLRMIGGAKHLIVLDMFLFNDFLGKEKLPYRRLTQEVTDALLKQKTKYPEMSVVVITDPINTVYGGLSNHYFEKMKAEDIQVVLTGLERLRDSNPLYSSFWRIFIKPFGNSSGSLLPNPFGRGRVSLRSYLAMLNFKANHRKVIIADSAKGYAALVTSANPHDGSSAHGNVAIYFTGPAVHDLLESERAVLGFSGGVSFITEPESEIENVDSEIAIQVLSERKIKNSLLAALDRAGPGDSLDLIVFYLSDREIIAAMKKAYSRGATLRVLLDPNKDAFGRRKNGIPNRQVAKELVKHGIPVRWSDTHGEQSHAKMLLAEYSQGRSVAVLGSANFTRRNLNNLNLETDIAVYGPSKSSLFADIRKYFDMQWANTEARKFSVDYTVYSDLSLLRRMLYRWMEGTGMSTF